MAHSAHPSPASAKRILFVIGQLNIGGAERHLLSTTIELRKRGWQAEIFCLSEEGALAAEARRAGIPLYSSRLFGKPIKHYKSKSIRLGGALASLATHLLARRPDIIHFFLPDAYVFGGFCAWLLRIRPCIMSRRSLNIYQQSRRPWLTKAELFLHQRMTLICGNSQGVNAQLLDEGVPVNRLRLIYSGVNREAFDKLPDKSVLRQKFGLPADALILSMVANIISYKGHEYLIRALAAIQTEMPCDWQLLLIGRDDGGGDSLKQLADDLGVGQHVHWLGTRADVPQLLGCADIGIHCSQQEGFSNAILEGMAAGLPMIASRVGGNPEAVQDQITGILVPPGDYQLLGAAILQLSDNPTLREQMGTAGKSRVANEFSVEKCIAGYESLYREAQALAHGEKSQV